MFLIICLFFYPSGGSVRRYTERHCRLNNQPWVSCRVWQQPGLYVVHPVWTRGHHSSRLQRLLVGRQVRFSGDQRHRSSQYMVRCTSRLHPRHRAGHKSIATTGLDDRAAVWRGRLISCLVGPLIFLIYLTSVGRGGNYRLCLTLKIATLFHQNKVYILYSERCIFSFF